MNYKNNIKKHFELITIGVYLLLFVFVIVAIQQIWFKEIISSVNFTNWDAEHYKYIKEFGYQGFRVAFFPLFPLIWKLFNVNELGIVIINALFFLFSFYILIKKLNIKSIKEIALYLSIPSFIFFYLPYSESLFFLCSIIILLGLKKNIHYLVYIGLLFAILSRPAFTVFIPALIITELLSNRKGKGNLIIYRISAYLLISIIGIVIVGVIQHIDTGIWFNFFSVQKGWGNQLQIPHLPLTSWGGGFTVRTDGFAFLIGILSGGYLLLSMLKLKYFKEKTIPKEVIFSLSYIGGITLLVLLFRGGSLFSLNRFVFATPFIIIILNYWINLEFHLKLKHLLSIFGLVLLFWLFFGSYVHIQSFLKFTLLSLYVLLLFNLKSDKQIIKNSSFVILIIVNFTFQIIFYLKFLLGEWIG